jgi:hypothetical protein
MEGLGIGELATNLAIGKVARLADAVEARRTSTFLARCGTSRHISRRNTWLPKESLVHINSLYSLLLRCSWGCGESPLRTRGIEELIRSLALMIEKLREGLFRVRCTSSAPIHI